MNYYINPLRKNVTISGIHRAADIKINSLFYLIRNQHFNRLQCKSEFGNVRRVLSSRGAQVCYTCDEYTKLTDLPSPVQHCPALYSRIETL